MYNRSFVKKLEWMNCEPTEADAKDFLSGCDVLEELKVSIVNNPLSIALYVGAFKKLQKLSFSSRIASDLLLPRCSESCLKDLHVRNQDTLVIPHAVFNVRPKIKT